MIPVMVNGAVSALTAVALEALVFKSSSDELLYLLTIYNYLLLRDLGKAVMKEGNRNEL